MLINIKNSWAVTIELTQFIPMSYYRLETLLTTSGVFVHIVTHKCE